MMYRNCAVLLLPLLLLFCCERLHCAEISTAESVSSNVNTTTTQMPDDVDTGNRQLSNTMARISPKTQDVARIITTGAEEPSIPRRKSLLELLCWIFGMVFIIVAGATIIMHIKYDMFKLCRNLRIRNIARYDVNRRGSVEETIMLEMAVLRCLMQDGKMAVANVNNVPNEREQQELELPQWQCQGAQEALSNDDPEAEDSL